MLVALAFALGLSNAPPRAEAVHVTSVPAAIRVSGQLSEEVWQRATPVDAFVQREPHEGGVPTQRTEFRVAYDSSTLFVKVRAFDREPARIVSYLTRRDADSPSDWIRILIDSYHDKRTALRFLVDNSVLHHERHVSECADVLGRVAVERDEIREQSGCHPTNLVLPAQHTRRD
jgi:hypothetical protein